MGALVAVACTAFAAGCGGDDSASGEGGTPTLRVAVPFASEGSAHPFVAEANGYFKDAGVNVVMDVGVGANHLGLLTSGRADVTLFGLSQPLSAINQGNDVSVIYGYNYDGNAGSVAVPKDSSVRSVEELAGKEVGVYGQSSSYGNAQSVSSYLEKSGKKGFSKVRIFNDVQTLNASLKSGRIAAGFGSANYFGTSLQSGEFKLILDSRKPEVREQYFGNSQLPSSAYFALKKTVGEKRDAMVRFVQAIDRANEYINASTPEQIAETVKKNKAFDTRPMESLVYGLDFAKAFVAENGAIDEAEWSDVLSMIGTWDLPWFKADDPRFAYGEVVDMSLLEEKSSDTKTKEPADEKASASTGAKEG